MAHIHKPLRDHMKHQFFLRVEEGILLRTLVLNYGHGYAEEGYATNEESRKRYYAEMQFISLTIRSNQHNRFTALISRTTWGSTCQKRTSGLHGARQTH